MKKVDIVKQMDSADVLDISCRIENGKGCITIFPKEQYKDDSTLTWQVKISSGGSVIKTIPYSRENTFFIKNLTNGKNVFFVEAKNSRQAFKFVRRSMHYFDEETISAFNKFYDGYTPCKSKCIDLYNLRYPYQNLAVISAVNGDVYDILSGKFSDYLCSLLPSTGSRTNCVLSTLKPLESENSLFFFSGKTKYDHKLIFGQNDIPATADLPSFVDEVGYFSAIYQNETGILFTNDYFGMNALYSYIADDIGITTNSYHFLLLIMKALGVKIELAPEIVVPYFVTGERMMFEQLASHDTFVKKCKKLAIHEQCVINLSGMKIINKPLADVLSADVEYNEEEYKRLLDESAKEIIENVQIALDDKRFDNILLDVTGGKDSRTVLAAMMNTHGDYTDKVRINSKDTPDGKEKLSFLPLNHLHSYKYNDKANRTVPADVEKRMLYYRSLSMGVSFSKKNIWDKALCKEDFDKTLQLIGAGEQILRTTFSVYFANVDYSSPESLMNSCVSAYNNGLLSYDNVCDLMKTLLTKGFDEILGSDYYEVFNHHCLYFRNTYHFGLELSFDCMEYGKEQWSPLYNKHAMAAWHMVCSKFKGARFQLELIDHLCPIFTKIPFASDADNAKMQKLQHEENFLDKRFDRINIPLDIDESDWLAANKTLVDAAAPSSDNTAVYTRFYSDVMQGYNKILHYDPLFAQKLGVEVYDLLICNRSAIEKGKANADTMFICNKVMSVSDIIDIITE